MVRLRRSIHLYGSICRSIDFNRSIYLDGGVNLSGSICLCAGVGLSGGISLGRCISFGGCISFRRGIDLKGRFASLISACGLIGVCRSVYDASLVALSSLISAGSLVHLSLHGLVGLRGLIELLRHLLSDWKLHWHWPLGLRERGRIHLSLRLVLSSLSVNISLFSTEGLNILLDSLRRKVLLPDVFGLVLLNLLIDLSLFARVGSGVDGRLGFNLGSLLRERGIIRLHGSLVSLDWLRLGSGLGHVSLGLLWLLGWLLNW